jgi:glycosyltransferase involved in cell wall biosynthesis
VYKGKKVGVVVPAHNEALLVGRVLSTMPDFVDRIIVVNDASTDKTADVVRSHRAFESGRITLLHHEKNQGVGDSHLFLKLHKACSPEGNAFLSLLTKIASGYWHIADSQSGYTAITSTALRRIKLEEIYSRYGMPNDILIRLNVANFRVRDVSVKPIYDIGEKSGIRLYSVIPRIAWLLWRGFLWRLKEKYVIRDFHPLLFFYLMGLILTPVGVALGAWSVLHRVLVGPIAPTTAIFAAFLFISGCQSLFFAMWFDLDYNKHLR